MNQPRLEVAGVAKIDGLELFAALIEREEFKIRGSVVEPGHALGGGAPRAGRDDDFEPAEVAARVSVLAAVVEPENSQGKNAVDDGRGFRGADADDRVGGCSLEQAAAHVGGTEAVFEIHGRAQAVDFGADEVAREHALEQPLVVAPRGVARRRSAAVAGGRELQRLRLGCAHAARDEAQALRALLQIDDGAHQVALFAPELQQAAAVRFGYGVVRGAHVEEDAAIFKQRRGGVVGQIFFDLLRELRGRCSLGPGGHFLVYQPMRERRLVMWAVWWRECHA